MKIIAFIFARGGSKGLPNKNIRLLNGKPLLQYSIDVAKQIPTITDIFVSTDCKQTAEVARKNNVKVIKRPLELALDSTPEWLAWRHAVEYVNKNFGEFNYFISLPTTSPLRNRDDVQASINKLIESNADICIGVSPASRSPYFNMVSMKPNNEVELVITPNKLVTRRQDSPDVYDITTTVYAATTQFIMKKNSIFDGKTVATIIPKSRSIDIDDIYDFKFAETLIKNEELDVKK